MVAIALGLCGVAAALLPPPTPASAQVPPELPAGFFARTVFTGLRAPTSVAFLPGGQALVAEQSGRVQFFSDLTDETPELAVDLTTQTLACRDRGLLGFVVNPDFPANPTAIATYTQDSERYGADLPPDEDDPFDPCPGGPDDPSLANVGVALLTLEPAETGYRLAGEPQVLVEGQHCQLSPSHSVGEAVWGPDGAVYVGAGDGASYGGIDIGSVDTPSATDPGYGDNGCLDPPNEGGALRAQDLRTRAAGDPVGLDGTIIRIDPATGAAPGSNPLASDDDPNAARIVAHGLRNPFRMTMRPGTDDLYIADVGYTSFEELNVHTDPAGEVRNFGWPCYEGPGEQEGYLDASTLCQQLQAEEQSTGEAVTEPLISYAHQQPAFAADRCSDPEGRFGFTGSSITGVEFYSGEAYPADYAGALFLADSSRGCVVVVRAGPDGSPDLTTMETFHTAAGSPVKLATGPGGHLYSVDARGGRVVQYLYSPTNTPPAAQVIATPATGSAPLDVTLDATFSTDPDPEDVLSYDWDLDGDGAYDDATGEIVPFTYERGRFAPAVRVTDAGGLSATARTDVLVDENAPEVTVALDGGVAPADLRWRAGQQVSFSARATDPQDGELGADAFRWRTILYHCGTGGGGCHTHGGDRGTGPAGSFATTRDHAEQSFLQFCMTATDRAGLADTACSDLYPQVSGVTFTAEPAGAGVVFNGTRYASPLDLDLVVNAAYTLSAPARQCLLETNYTDPVWSDGAGGGRRTVPAADTTLTVTYQPNGACGTAAATEGPGDPGPVTGEPGSVADDPGPITGAGTSSTLVNPAVAARRVAERGEVFAVAGLDVDQTGDRVLVAGPDGGPLLVDDLLRVTVAPLSGGTPETLVHDFSDGCGPLRSAGPFDIAGLLQPGGNRVSVELVDRCGGFAEATPITLVLTAPDAGPAPPAGTGAGGSG